MRTKMIALASAVAASLAFAPMAEAGGGVRLNFGGPLGTFTATPSKSAASKPAHRARSARKHAVRKSRPKPAVRQASKTPSARPAAGRKAAAAAAKVKDAPKTQVARADTETELHGRRTGSAALIHIDTSESGGSRPAAKDDTATDPEPETAAAEQTTDADETENSGATCAKFIPAVGTTVTVGCDE